MTKLRLFALLAGLGTETVAQDVRFVAPDVRSLLRDASLLEDLTENDNAVPQDYVAAARADYPRMLTALYAEGYYGGTVSITIDGVEAATMDPLAAPSQISEVVVRVNAGPAFEFGDLSATPLPDGTTLPDGFRRGEVAESDVIRSAVSNGRSAWRNLGYGKVRVSNQQIVAQHDDAELNVSVTYDTGPRLTFGTLIITGNEDVNTDRINEIAGFPTGEVYSPATLNTVEQRLRRTGAFNSVSLTEADNIGPGDTLDVTAQIAEAKPRRIGVGLELSSIEGLTVSGFWLHRNWLGGAERFRIDTEVSGIDGETGGTDYTIGTSFNRPATFGPDTDFFVTSELSREDEPDYLLDQFDVEVGFSRILTEDLTVQAAVGLLRAQEESDLGDRQYTLLTFPLQATLDRRDDPTNAKNGYYLDVEATPFLSLNDEDINGMLLFNDIRGYRSFGDQDQITLAARGQIGSMMGATIDQAPADFLFYSGGGGTVRGQPYNDLGIDRIEDGETVTTGGTSFAGAQLEARYEVRNKLSLVGFYDIGYVGDTETPLEGGDWHAGAGIGLRYETGIGPIRLDLGTPASGDDAGEELQVYIGIGQAF